MTADQMQVGIPYIVTKPSRHREFQPGDRITLRDDGSIDNLQAQGWMEAEHLAEATRGMECEIHQAYLSRKAEALRLELAAVEGMKARVKTA